MSMYRYYCFLHAIALFFCVTNAFSQIQYWVMGGEGFQWEASDSSNVMIEFNTEKNNAKAGHNDLRPWESLQEC